MEEFKTYESWIWCDHTQQCEESRPLVSKEGKIVRYKGKLVTLSDRLWELLKHKCK
jgi:hypothetical protein